MPLIKVFGNLRSLAGSASFSKPGLTPRAVLNEIQKDNPALYDAILVEGALRPHVRLMVAGRDIELAQGLDTPIREDDELAIFPPIAGGYGRMGTI